MDIVGILHVISNGKYSDIARQDHEYYIYDVRNDAVLPSSIRCFLALHTRLKTNFIFFRASPQKCGFHWLSLGRVAANSISSL